MMRIVKEDNAMAVKRMSCDYETFVQRAFVLTEEKREHLKKARTLLSLLDKHLMFLEEDAYFAHPDVRDSAVNVCIDTMKMLVSLRDEVLQYEQQDEGEQPQE